MSLAVTKNSAYSRHVVHLKKPSSTKSQMRKMTSLIQPIKMKPMLQEKLLRIIFRSSTYNLLYLNTFSVKSVTSVVSQHFSDNYLPFSLATDDNIDKYRSRQSWSKSGLYQRLYLDFELASRPTDATVSTQ